MKKNLIGIVVIIATSFVLAVVTNAVAGRERKLLLGGFYPDPFKVPAGQQRTATKPAAASDSAAVPPMTSTTGWITGTVESTGTSARTATVSPVPSPTTSTATASTSTVANTTTAAPTVAPRSATQAAASPEPAVDLVVRFPPHPDKAYLEVGWTEVALLHRRGALFLDARRTAAFEEGRIAGSRAFSVWESDIDDKVNALFGERSSAEQQAQPIVIYCSGGACEDSHMLAQKLWGVEFNNVLVYKDGYPDWVKRGGAIKAGK